MEKNTVLAVVLSTIVLLVFFVWQNANEVKRQAQQQQSHQSEINQPEQPIAVPTEIPDAEEVIVMADPPLLIQEEGAELEYITIETNTVTVVLTNAGGDMVSWKLKKHEDKDEPVDMIFRDNNENALRAFSIAFGDMNAQPVSGYFNVEKINDYSVKFYRDFTTPNTNENFRLTKQYDFKPNDYMFELTVTMEGASNIPYSLSFGPQIGPRFEKLDARYDYRQYFTYTNGKMKEVKKLNNIIDDRPTWIAISGKYFTFIAIPHLAQYSAKFTQTENFGGIPPTVSQLSINRPSMNQRTVTDSYKFYLGPKSQEVLNVYHTGLNDFGFKETSLTQAASSRGILSPLEKLLKWLLLIIVKVVPKNNYGVAIIFLTLLIKIVFFPLTKKSSEATSRMQELAPKIKEIQEKYKGNPQKLNAEMAQFYQKEGYNPLSGCLPMLLQIPIFIAMYSLFNNHFDLRGASFIAGWIPDLSLPEHIVLFPDGFKLPILGWTALRGLPFIYVGSQLMYGKFTQTPGQQTQGQMKMMLYVMPIMFFFILYNVPSGLLLYWIFSNIFTLIQQIIINKYKHVKALQNPATVIEEPKNKIVPNKKKRRN